MKTDGERLRELRKELNIKQGEFAEKISTTQGHISDIENGRKNLSDRTIKLICLEDWNGHTVNETWLRTGKGKIFNELSKENQLMDWAGRVLKDESDSFKRRFVSMLMELDDSDWEVLEKIALKLQKESS